MNFKVLIFLFIKCLYCFTSQMNDWKDIGKFILDKFSYLLPHDREDHFPYFNFFPAFKNFVKPGDEFEFVSHCYQKILIETELEPNNIVKV